MRIAICDDQNVHLEKVHDAVVDYLARHDAGEAEITDYSDPEEFMQSLRKEGGWDIVLLDVCMPGFLGTDLAREIRSRHDRTEIIFLSVSDDFAVEAFSLKAAHYVLKPFTQNQFDEAMDRAMAPFLRHEPRKLLLQLENGVVQAIEADDILYVESVAYRRIVHTAAAVYEETRKTLSKMLEELEALCPGQFLQPYRGYVVNLDAIRTIASDRLVLRNGDSILIKRGDFRRLREKFFEWSFRSTEEAAQ